MASATITSKGQLTIPKTVRDSLRLHMGGQGRICHHRKRGGAYEADHKEGR